MDQLKIIDTFDTYHVVDDECRRCSSLDAAAGGGCGRGSDLGLRCGEKAELGCGRGMAIDGRRGRGSGLGVAADSGCSRGSGLVHRCGEKADLGRGKKVELGRGLGMVADGGCGRVRRRRARSGCGLRTRLFFKFLFNFFVKEFYSSYMCKIWICL